MRTDLGNWIKQRLRWGIEGQGSAAQDTLDQCEVSIEELQAKWSQQRQSQLSIHACKFYTFLNDVAIAQ
jgi:hypothetical protein